MSFELMPGETLGIVGESGSGKLDVAYLLVAHDLSVVAELSDRITVMYGGQILELGETRQVVADPRHPYTRVFLDAVPIPDPLVEHARKIRPSVPEWPTPDDPLPPCPIIQSAGH